MAAIDRLTCDFATKPGRTTKNKKLHVAIKS